MSTRLRLKPIHDRPGRPVVAAVLAFGCVIVATFQAALTLGAPFGAAALGGANLGQLPDPLRMVTGFATLLWLCAALLVLSRGGLPLFPVPSALSRIGTWVLVGLLGVGTLLNLASSSPWERFGWGPFTLVMSVLGIVLARSGFATARTTPEVDRVVLHSAVRRTPVCCGAASMTFECRVWSSRRSCSRVLAGGGTPLVSSRGIAVKDSARAEPHRSAPFARPRSLEFVGVPSDHVGSCHGIDHRLTPESDDQISGWDHLRRGSHGLHDACAASSRPVPAPTTTPRTEGDSTVIEAIVDASRVWLRQTRSTSGGGYPSPLRRGGAVSCDDLAVLTP
jgi:hypothetical protein